MTWLEYSYIFISTFVIVIATCIAIQELDVFPIFISGMILLIFACFLGFVSLVSTKSYETYARPAEILAQYETPEGKHFVVQGFKNEKQTVVADTYAELKLLEQGAVPFVIQNFSPTLFGPNTGFVSYEFRHIIQKEK